MQARDILEVAALVACHAPALVEAPGELSAVAIEQYWSASKCRLDRWGRALKEHSSTPSSGVASVLEEILAGEVLTRVWTAAMVSHDRFRGVEEAGPPAQSIYTAHLEARGRVLHFLLSRQGMSGEQSAALNTFRRRAERWTDALLARMATIFDLSEFAHDPDATRSLAADIRIGHGPSTGTSAWSPTLAALRLAFHPLSPASLPNADLGSQIAAGVLAHFGPSTFDSLGTPSTVWMVRLLGSSHDLQTHLSEWFASDADLAKADSIAVDRRRLGRGPI